MADFSFIAAYIPNQDKEPWLTIGDCRVFYNSKDQAIHLVKGYYSGPYSNSKNAIGGEDGIIIDLYNKNLSPIKEGDQTWAQKAEAKKQADGSLKLIFDLVKVYLDTGGYIIRDQAEVKLSDSGKLQGFSAVRTQARKKFFFFGPYVDFKPIQSVHCP